MSLKTIATPIPALLTLLAILVSLASLVPSASAATPSPAWSIESLATPSVFHFADNAECEKLPPEEAFQICDTYQVTATNIGSVPTSGAIVLADSLPAGVTGYGVSLFVDGVEGHVNQDLVGLESRPGVKVCTLTPVRCELTRGFLEKNLGVSALAPGDAVKLYVSVTVDAIHTAELVNEAKVAGGIPAIEGGTTPSEVSASRTNSLEGEPSSFGVSFFDAPFVGVDGQPEHQAGAHPYELATVLGLNGEIRAIPEGPTGATSVQDLRDVMVDLPVGVAGSGVMAPTCTLAVMASKGAEIKQGESRQGKSGCPTDTIVGHIRSYPESTAGAQGPIYNLLPEEGYAAELGFIDALGGTHVLYVSLAPTPSGYVLRTTTSEVPQLLLDEVIVSVFGDPAARDGSSEPAIPTFTNPEHCTGEPLVTTVHVDSWQARGAYNTDGSPDFSGDPHWKSTEYSSPPVTGCEALAGLFAPTIATATSTTSADTPTGLDVELKVPQHEEVEGLSTPPLRDTTITLPAGLTVNPSSANGLEACSLEQVGISAAGVPNAAPPHCPDGSKIGTVELETPALAMQRCKHTDVPLRECPAGESEHTPLLGSIYLARQLENPFASLIAIYIIVNDPRTGVLVKIPAKVTPDETTGQLTTTVIDTPQFPFSVLRTHFFAGDTAPLRTPATCGTFTLSSVLTPWSAPQSGPPATPASQFEVASGPGGGPCAASEAEEPNAPSFEAGTTTPTAGAFSPLVVHLTRGDGSQNFSRVNVTLPPGATGKLAGIPQCSDAQIAAAQARGGLGEGAAELASPSCPAASEVGQVTVGAGAGPKPFFEMGHAYLAGPYEGAPFSLAIITPAVAGPFDLGVVVVRAGLYVNPATAQVTTKSDPIPAILHGIPLDVRSVTVNIDRPEFTLNPTNCTPMTVTGEEISTQGHVAPLSNHFQVGSCQNLAFKPDLTASTAGKASKAGGASLDVKVAYPSAPFTGYSNIRSVKVSLPKQLPSRLTTLQKACLASVFEANPAGCPAASDVGTATAGTPLLSSPLSGPAYIVSHGNEAFPDLEIVLQGENITLILDGNTQIKNGITSSTFKSVPDAPVSSFELKLPTGKFSILGANVPQKANYSLCGQNLTMPTEITAQNGAQINQTTKIAITGCTKAVRHERKKTHKKKKKE